MQYATIGTDVDDDGNEHEGSADPAKVVIILESTLLLFRPDSKTKTTSIEKHILKTRTISCHVMISSIVTRIVSSFRA